jgi:hypothetical protein
MESERDTWPPRNGQRVRVRPTGSEAVVMELLAGGWVAVRRALMPGRTEFEDDLFEEWSLTEFEPEHPHRVPEYQEPPE